MTKKIVIVTQKMVIGGIEKALIDMLKKIPADKYETKVLVVEEGGEFYNFIPDFVKIDLIPDIKCKPINLLVKKKKSTNLLTRFKAILENKRGTDFWSGCKNHVKLLPQYPFECDLAIAYSSPVSFATAYVSENINAKKKCVWIHNEVDKISVNIKECKNIYDRFDKIFCVSKLAKKKLIKIFPEYTDKTEVFYNFIDADAIKNNAEKGNGFDDDFDGFRILTVGRVCHQKGQDIIPRIANELIKWNDNFKWYCVGDGDYMGRVETEIENLNLGNKVILLGKTDNPYAFFKECDIYVQPSRHEGFGLTIAEAKCFCKPIVSTYFAGIDEQIINGVNGYVVQFDVQEIAMKILELMNNNDISRKFSTEIDRENKNEKCDINQLLDMVK